MTQQLLSKTIVLVGATLLSAFPPCARADEPSPSVVTEEHAGDPPNTVRINPLEFRLWDIDPSRVMVGGVYVDFQHNTIIYDPGDSEKTWQLRRQVFLISDGRTAFISAPSRVVLGEIDMCVGTSCEDKLEFLPPIPIKPAALNRDTLHALHLGSYGVPFPYPSDADLRAKLALLRKHPGRLSKEAVARLKGYRAGFQGWNVEITPLRLPLGALGAGLKFIKHSRQPFPARLLLPFSLDSERLQEVAYADISGSPPDASSGHPGVSPDEISYSLSAFDIDLDGVDEVIVTTGWTHCDETFVLGWKDGTLKTFGRTHTGCH